VKWATKALSLALLVAAGCSLGDGSDPKPAREAAREIAALVKRLEQASARGDWRSICDQLFTANARRRAGGRDCPRLLRSDAAGLAEPRIEVRRITVKGPRAAVRVRSRARGQAPLEDVIELRREGGRYRIESLAA